MTVGFGLLATQKKLEYPPHLSCLRVLGNLVEKSMRQSMILSAKSVFFFQADFGKLW